MVFFDGTSNIPNLKSRIAGLFVKMTLEKVIDEYLHGFWLNTPLNGLSD